jgi:hypothetical protein
MRFFCEDAMLATATVRPNCLQQSCFKPQKRARAFARKSACQPRLRAYSDGKEEYSQVTKQSGVELSHSLEGVN